MEPQNPLDEMYHSAPKRFITDMLHDLQRLYTEEHWHHPNPVMRQVARLRLAKWCAQVMVALRDLPPDSGRDYTNAQETASSHATDAGAPGESP